MVFQSKTEEYCKVWFVQRMQYILNRFVEDRSQRMQENKEKVGERRL